MSRSLYSAVGSMMEQMPSPEDLKRQALKQYKLGTESIGAWRLSALSLERGANILWDTVLDDWRADFTVDDPDRYWTVSGTFMLLAGLTVENYLKAVCIKRSGAAFDSNNKFAFFGHNLVALGETSGLQFSTQELELLERLTNFVEFAGRYPAPNKPEALIPKIKPDGSFRGVRTISGTDQFEWKALVKKLTDELGPL